MALQHPMGPAPGGGAGLCKPEVTRESGLAKVHSLFLVELLRLVPLQHWTVSTQPAPFAHWDEGQKTLTFCSYRAERGLTAACSQRARKRQAPDAGEGRAVNSDVNTRQKTLLKGKEKPRK